MDKVIDFCKKKYKLLIPVMVVLVLLIAFYFLYKEYQYDNKRKKEEVSVYQYFSGIRNDYTAIFTYNLKDVIVNVSAKDKKIDYDSTPIYYSEEDKIVFPYEMNIVYPLKDGSQYRLYKYSIYEYQNDLHYIKTGVERFKDNFFFLYDGANLYFFPSEATIKIDGEEYTKMGPMSYARLVGGYTLTYYDKENDKSEFLEVEGKTITIETGDTEINLNERYFMNFGKKILLFDPSNLNAAK